MKTPVMLSLRSTQRYGEQEAEVLELTTEGTMEFRDGGWDISYRESATDRGWRGSLPASGWSRGRLP